jgi:hypothetical protein
MIFLRFLTIFQRFSLDTLDTITDRPSKYFLEITNRSLDYGKLPGIIREEAM